MMLSIIELWVFVRLPKMTGKGIVVVGKGNEHTLLLVRWLDFTSICRAASNSALLQDRQNFHLWSEYKENFHPHRIEKHEISSIL